MSFRCALCGKYAGNGHSPTRKVVRIRPVTYETQMLNKKGGFGPEVKSTGFEISKEIQICTPCALKERSAPERSDQTKVVKATALRVKRARKKREGRDSR